MYRELIYDVKDPIATITLNRPDRLNALTGRLLDEIKHAVATAEADEKVVGIILTGEGRGFCAGADMQGLKSTADGSARDQEERLDSSPGDPALGADFAITYSYLLAVRKPLIAAINGPCAGLGFVIAMLCDMRFASERAVFTTAFANRGLIAEHGSSWILPRLIGPSRALDILWSGRKFDAAEADRLGVVNRVVPHEDLLPETESYIKDLATRSAPVSLMTMKQQVYKHLMVSLGPAMEESNRLMAESLKRNDFKEGVNSYLERRPPNFERINVS